MGTKKLRLTKPHTHSGKRYLPGDVLELPTRVAKWLEEQDVGEVVVPETSTTPPVARSRRACCGR